MVSELFLVVALSMAITPFLAEAGQRLGKAFEKSDMQARWAGRRQACWEGPAARISSLGAAASADAGRTLWRNRPGWLDRSR